MSDTETRVPVKSEMPKPEEKKPVAQPNMPMPPKQEIPVAQPKTPQPMHEKHTEDKKQPA